MIASEDDQSLDSVGVCRLAKESTGRVAKTNCKVLTFPSIGHLVNLPNTPLAKCSTQPAFPSDTLLDYGGKIAKEATVDRDCV